MHHKIERLADQPTKRSDHDNGYYIQESHWGTCFHRRATKWQDFHIYHNRRPQFLHTYTKVPLHAWENVWSVYLNYRPGQVPVLEIGKHDIIVGFDHPQASGEYLNRSFLVYSPEGVPPGFHYAPATPETDEDPEGFYVQSGEEKTWFNVAMFFRGKEGIIIPIGPSGRRVETHKIASFKIGDLL